MSPQLSITLSSTPELVRRVPEKLTKTAVLLASYALLQQELTKRGVLKNGEPDGQLASDLLTICADNLMAFALQPDAMQITFVEVNNQ